MNIWIFNQYAENPEGQATRTYDLSRQLVERGHRVTIFASGFNHNTLKEERVLGRERWVEQNYQGVRFVWIKTIAYSGNDFRRVVNMLQFSWRALRAASSMAESPDVVVGVSVHPLAALVGWVTARSRHARFFFELTDLWPEVLIDFGLLSKANPVTWALRKLEIFLYRRAEKIIMIWPRTESYVERFGIPADKVVWIPHGVDLNHYRELQPYDGRIKDKFRIMYVGAFVNFMKMEVILETAKILQDRNRASVEFVFVGGGTQRQRLIELAEQMGLRNVQFIGVVPKKQLADVTGAADAFVVSLKKVPLLRYGISLNKLCDYFASRRPVLLAGDPGYDPVNEAGAGISVEPENALALADAVERLMSLSPADRVGMGRKGFEYLEREHSIIGLADRLERLLQRQTTVNTSSLSDNSKARIPV